MKTALVIEDDPFAADFIKHCLRSEGWEPIGARDGFDALNLAKDNDPDLVILDLSMPHLDGAGFLVKFRRSSSVPVIVVSARDGEDIKAQLLDLGADDFLAKPFSPVEFMARVRAVVRRTNPGDYAGDELSTRGLTIDYGARRVSFNKCDVLLSAHEYELLCLLAGSAGKVITFKAILDRIWYSGCSDNHYVQECISSIKHKLGLNTNIITNVRGIGYRLG